MVVPPEDTELSSQEASSGFPKHLKEDTKPVLDAAATLAVTPRSRGQSSESSVTTTDSTNTMSTTLTKDRVGEDRTESQSIAVGTSRGIKTEASTTGTTGSIRPGDIAAPDDRQEEMAKTSNLTTDRRREAVAETSHVPSTTPSTPVTTHQGLVYG